LATFSEHHITDEEREGVTVRDYLSVLWRRKWVVILVTVVAAAAAFGFSYRQSRVYQGRTDLIYQPQLDVANPLTGQSYTDPTQMSVELNAVDAVIHSPSITRPANGVLQQKGLPASGFTVSSQLAQAGTTSTSSQASNVVSVLATDGQPKVAAAVSQTYADTFVKWRAAQARMQIGAAIDAVKKQMHDYPAAAKQSSDYIILQQRLRDLQILMSTATGNFSVLAPATVPQAPISPKPLRSAILGFAIGLFAGIGLAFLMEQFDTKVRRPDDIAEVLHQPILARVPRLSREQVKSPELVTLAQPADHASEAFRLLRTNLAFMNVDGTAKTLMVTSSLQGEGKSVTLANLAVTLALAGKKVIVVDADMRRPRQHTLFGLRNTAGLSSVAVGDADLVETLQPVQVISHNGDRPKVDFISWAAAAEAVSRLWVLTSGPIPPNPGEIVASQRFTRLLGALRDAADIVLIDSPAMLAVGDAAALASEVEGLVFLVDMEQARRPVLQAAADQLCRLPCAMMGLVVRLPAGGRGDRGYYYAHYRYEHDAIHQG
jgi:Mrp family chromosome partitioning ATPase/capsular polysaccharide biosynthesis protein